MLGRTSDFSRRLLKWYPTHRRDLPWRLPIGTVDAGARVDPYRVFISEAMLQQTQVATVIPYFDRLLSRFPSFDALAAAEEQEVLRLWQGLGYYSRARNLHRAAKIIASDGLPRDPKLLLDLPGVGRYTAGAIASIAFGNRCPILDGNVIRVLCRIDAIESDPRDPIMREVLWTRAADVLPRRGDCGDFNSALMELGATICTPRSPKCLVCPVRLSCSAAAKGIQERIPLRFKRQPTPQFERFVWCIRSGDRYLIEQRPTVGRWAGMWQFITRETNDPAALPVPITASRPLMEIDHALTHRRYRFHAFSADARSDSDAGTWVTLDELSIYPLPKPHVKMAQRLAS